MLPAVRAGEAASAKGAGPVKPPFPDPPFDVMFIHPSLSPSYLEVYTVHSIVGGGFMAPPWHSPIDPRNVARINPALFKVRCDSATGDLVPDGIYSVLETRVEMDGETSYLVADSRPRLVHSRFAASRFQILPASSFASGGTELLLPSKVNPLPDGLDETEARLRRMLRPSLLPHECPCGIARAVCSYHGGA